MTPIDLSILTNPNIPSAQRSELLIAAIAAGIWPPVPEPLTGLLGNDAAKFVGDSVGDRPLASIVVGRLWSAVDQLYTGIAITHPHDATKRIWWPIAATRVQPATASALGNAAARFGVYDPTTGVFTQATIAGQFCNAWSQLLAAGGAPVNVNLAPTLNSVVGPVGGTIAGAEFMTDAAGLAVPYVAGAGIVALGVWRSNTIPGASGLPIFYDY